MSEWRLDPIGDDDSDGADAPICAACGVTALPQGGDIPFSAGGEFECANDDCAAFGEVVSA